MCMNLGMPKKGKKIAFQQNDPKVDEFFAVCVSCLSSLSCRFPPFTCSSIDWVAAVVVDDDDDDDDDDVVVAIDGRGTCYFIGHRLGESGERSRENYP